MITVCAGRLTPQASVEVQTSSLSRPHSKSCSVSERSGRSMPAWCTPMPLANSCCTSAERDLSTWRFQSE